MWTIEDVSYLNYCHPYVNVIFLWIVSTNEQVWFVLSFDTVNEVFIAIPLPRDDDMGSYFCP